MTVQRQAAPPQGEVPERPLSATGAPLVVKIYPPQGWTQLQSRELWAYREVLYFLVWRDIKVRYKQTVLGVAWAILQPFMTMVVFSLFFGQWAGMPSGDVPYPIFTYSALIPWVYFANALTQASNSLVLQKEIITKVYFPRLLIPAAAVLAGLLDFILAFLVLVGMMLFYDIVPTAAILTVPLFVLFVMATAFGVSLWLSALNVQYRDVHYIVPFLIQFWLFATPVAYASTIVPESLRTLYGINPMVGVVEGFRWALLGQADAPGVTIALSLLVTAVILVGGLYYFRRMEDGFADVV